MKAGTLTAQWLREYVAKLLSAAAEYPEGDKMRAAITLRADHILDMIETWLEETK
jgi:hypothetical protein